MNQHVVDAASVMDLGAAMAQMDGDAELLREIVEIFVETGPEQLQALDTAVDAGDAATVALVAHGMKGGASNFCAGRFVAAARALEMLAKDGGLDGAADLLAHMQTAFTELVEVAAVVNWNEVERQWGV